MVTIILLATAFSGIPDSVNHRAVVRPESAIFEFQVQYDTAWTIGSTEAPVRTPEYEWTVSTVVRDTVFSFGYQLYKESYAGALAGAITFADARTRFGDRRLFANGSADQTVTVDVTFEASRVVVRLNDAATIRRVFALRQESVQFSYRIPGRNRVTIDVPVEYAGKADVAGVSARTDAQQPSDLPDSTYLRLVLELPTVGTFSYDVLSRERLVNVYSEIRDVDVSGCMLSFQVWVQQIAQGAQSRFPRNFYQTTAAIPLDAIDSTALTIRAAHPQGNYKYDPQPWSLRIPVRPDAKFRIMVGNLEHSHKAPRRSIDLVVKDYDTAALVKGWLSDGASRCKSWTTTPLKPVR